MRVLETPSWAVDFVNVPVFDGGSGRTIEFRSCCGFSRRLPPADSGGDSGCGSCHGGFWFRRGGAHQPQQMSERSIRLRSRGMRTRVHHGFAQDQGTTHFRIEGNALGQQTLESFANPDFRLTVQRGPGRQGEQDAANSALRALGLHLPGQFEIRRQGAKRHRFRTQHDEDFSRGPEQ